MPVGEFLQGAQARSLERPARDAGRAGEAAAGLRPHPPDPRPVRPGARRPSKGRSRSSAGRLGPDHPETLDYAAGAGRGLPTTGATIDRARALLDESLERHRRIYGEEDARTARVLAALAPVVGAADSGREGELLRRALEIRRAALGPDHPDVASSLASLGGVPLPPRGERACRRVLPPGARRVPGTAGAKEPDRHRDPQRARQRADRCEPARGGGGAAARGDRAGAADPRSREHDGGRPPQQPRDDPGLPGPARRGRTLVSSEPSRRIVALVGEEHWRTRNVARNVGRALALQRRYAEALPWMDRSIVVPAGSGDARTRRKLGQARPAGTGALPPRAAGGGARGSDGCRIRPGASGDGPTWPTRRGRWPRPRCCWVAC